MIIAKGRVKRAEISAVITRADGTVENLGVIAEQNFGIRARISAILNKRKDRAHGESTG